MACFRKKKKQTSGQEEGGYETSEDQEAPGASSFYSAVGAKVASPIALR